MSIVPASVRATVQARFPDGRAFNGPAGTTAEAFMNVAQPGGKGQIVAALIDGQLRELTQPLKRDAVLVPVTTANSDGVRIYRRSLTFLMIVAAHDLFPGVNITVMHSMPFGGYYCERTDGGQFTADELKQLEAAMRKIVKADLAIEQLQTPLAEALKLFRDGGDLEKANLFSRRRKDYLTLYELNGVRDYFHGFMVPRTRYLDMFAIHPYANGFILHFPRRQRPDALLPFEDEPILARVFQEYAGWLRLIGVPGVASFNQALANGRAREIILVAEALHERQLGQIAMDIATRRPRIVLISGPTSAGKTTFSKRLAVQLMALGLHPVAIGMDNYFVDREHTPKDRGGDLDFEHIEAVDLPLFHEHLQELLAGRTIVQPEYDFHTGRRRWGDELNLLPNQFLIIEGIHGLNPRLVGAIDPKALYRIFISAFTQLNLDQHNRVPTTDTRLLRRIVRDAAHRGYTAADTIRRWPSVRRGEKQWIFPHQNNANVFFNSALVYELSALKPLAQPLLLQVEPGSPERIEANRLLAFLQWFDAVDPSLIPNNSILREFIGGSILTDFNPWVR